MNNKVKCSVVVVNWNSEKYIRECFNALLTTMNELKHKIDVEVIVVDNASTDSSVKIIEEEFKWVKLIKSLQNNGFSKANNIAIKYSTGEYILLLNTDAIINTSALKNSIEFLEENSDAGVAGCQLLNADGTNQQSFGRQLNFKNILIETLFLEKVFKLKNKTNNQPFEVDYVCGAYFLVKKQAIEEVGLLDEDYFFYVEEADWCYRMKKHGWTSYVIPTETVIHYRGGSSTKVNPFKYMIQLQKSKFIFARKHFSNLQFYLYKKLVIINAKIRRLRLKFKTGEDKLVAYKVQTMYQIEELARNFE
ncbi:glycosyltransferase family 2 protein [Bacillus pacificus]|uniref:glycosyltransferase family 2 protein n=1 Tax=Bacillus TaxID=1386 RepID=UPI00034BEF2F|nr:MULTISPECIES: glycosyltransferase family 2 protein [Bacillus cereus group]MCC2416551.1 glycosyltransferase family 2 protein [Bacillus pacificus]MCU5007373.1 glycosyltransferase family 2 protein [Bacillus pacificus]MCU5256449.1 glycosyltransferase family 2 protein [Bacillus pacificus]MCU5561480.1 glycosyltransferase family 2 protein [Bacillus pacificus]MDK7490039.1 glycosyltransferase family 2 protein [Bacillus paranthracis]